MPGNTILPSQRSAFPLIGLLILLLAFTLAACGTNTTTTGNPPATPAATPTASQSSSTGCPSTTTVTTPSSQANVVLKSANSNKVTQVKKGDVIEIELAFGRRWEDPDISKALLTEQASGYANTATKMCVWRFLAIGTGTAHINFVAHPICEPGEACPQYVQAVPFTLEIK